MRNGTRAEEALAARQIVATVAADAESRVALQTDLAAFIRTSIAAAIAAEVVARLALHTTSCRAKNAVGESEVTGLAE